MSNKQKYDKLLAVALQIKGVDGRCAELGESKCNDCPIRKNPNSGEGDYSCDCSIYEKVLQHINKWIEDHYNITIPEGHEPEYTLKVEYSGVKKIPYGTTCTLNSAYVHDDHLASAGEYCKECVHNCGFTNEGDKRFVSCDSEHWGEEKKESKTTVSGLIFTQEHPLKCQIHNEPMYLTRIDWFNHEDCALWPDEKRTGTATCGHGCKLEFKCKDVEHNGSPFDFKVVV